MAATQELDGQSFLHRLLERPGPQREWVFCDYAPRWGNREPARYVHDMEWKLYDDGRIFQIESDPFENDPRLEAQLPTAVQERISTFRAVLARMAREASDP